MRILTPSIDDTSPSVRAKSACVQVNVRVLGVPVVGGCVRLPPVGVFAIDVGVFGDKSL